MDTKPISARRRVPALSFVFAGIAGMMASTGWTPATGMVVLMAFLVVAQRSRSAAFSIALVHYAAATCPLLPGTQLFIWGNMAGFERFGLWFAVSTLLAAPYGFFWTANIFFRPLGIATAVLASSIPTLGMISRACLTPPNPVSFPAIVVVSCLAFTLIAFRPD